MRVHGDSRGELAVAEDLDQAALALGEAKLGEFLERELLLADLGDAVQV